MSRSDVLRFAWADVMAVGAAVSSYSVDPGEKGVNTGSGGVKVWAYTILDICFSCSTYFVVDLIQISTCLIIH